MIIIEREEKGSFIEIDLFCKSVGIGFASTSTLVHIFFNDFIHYLEYADILNIMLKKERRRSNGSFENYSHTQTQYDL